MIIVNSIINLDGPEFPQKKKKKTDPRKDVLIFELILCS